MADFGFVGPSYTAQSIYADAQECINFYPEIDPLKQPGDRGVVALYPTPGLTPKIVFQNSQEVRGMRTVSGGQQMVAVVGPYVYVLSTTFTPTIVGLLNTSTGRVGITDNGINVYIVDGAQRYTWRISNPSNATFTGSISGTTLTVTAITSGTISAGQALFGIGVASETVITALGSGSGGVGTYTINNSQTVASELLSSVAVASTLNAQIIGSTMYVNSSTGTLYLGQTIQGAGIAANTMITALGTGTGGTGTYTVSGTQTVPSVAATFTGQIAGTVLSATSVASGSIAVGQYVYGAGITPATTISASNPFTSTGSTIAVTTGILTIGVLTSGTISVGQVLTGTNVVAGTRIISNISGSGSGSTWNTTQTTATASTAISGQSYTVSASQTVSSEQMYSSVGQTDYALNFTQIPTTDGAFSGANTVDIVDNYFVYNRPNTQQWGASNALSPISNNISFSSKDGAPDNLVALIVDHREVYLLGEASSEVWVDVGAAQFPFQRIPGTSTQHGIAATFSVSRLGNSFAYLSRNNRGQAEIMQMNGYIPSRISTHAVENTLVGQYIDDAVAWTYQLEGHEIYVISFPTINLTWAYDIATNMWHKWLYYNNSGQFERHRGNCCAVFQGTVLVGDYSNGTIYKLDKQNYTDSGQTIRRVRRAPHLVTDFQREYFDELQIQFQPGVGTTGVSIATSGTSGNYLGDTYVIPSDATFTIGPYDVYFLGLANLLVVNNVTTYPQAMLRWSNDGGSTWSNEHWVTIGQLGRYKNRAIWRRLGMARDRVFEVVVTDPVNAVIVSANLKTTTGDN
jgi:hypothetical protein